MTEVALPKISKLDFVKGEKIYLRDFYNESGLKDIIVHNPSILNLGELEVIDREHVQSSGGRIDLLLYNSDLDIYYEVEVMLGKTDESHIIRTIEYWDIEKRKSPSRDHVAVIIAEEITNRFFNVIYLINRSIPIIAIQLNAIKIDDKLTLNFTKVLDLYEVPEEEPTSKTVDKKEWEKRVEKGQIHPKSFALMKDIIEMLQTNSQSSDNISVNYRQNYIAITKLGQNFMTFRPRGKEGYCAIDIRIKSESMGDIQNMLEEIDVSYRLKRDTLLRIFLQESEYYNNKEKLDGLFLKSKDYY